MLRANQLDAERACVLCIDIQEKLLPLIRRGQRVVANGRKLLQGVRVFHVPVIATEQYPKGLGPTVSALGGVLKACEAQMLEKPTFSAWAEPRVRDALIRLDRPQIIVFGIESHVCVQQSVLDLVSRDYDVYVCADAVGSRGKSDHKTALGRMAQDGTFVTTVESVLFELCGRCDMKQFKELLEVIKATPPDGEK
jgi:nicotinamidase-related amidase